MGTASVRTIVETASAGAANGVSRVLLVEDDLEVAAFVTDILSDAGYSVALAHNAKVASSGAYSADPAQVAVLITDLQLGGNGDGRAVIAALRHRRPRLPVVVLTGLSDCDEGADLRGLGGPTVRLHKPFGIDDLLNAVAVAVNGRPEDLLHKRSRRVVSRTGSA